MRSRLRSRLRLLTAPLLTAPLLLLLACGGSAPTAPSADPTPSPAQATARGYFPPRDGGAWATTTARLAGWDSAALESAVAYAGTRNSTALLVLHRGRLVAERYWGGWTAGTSAQIASAGKSVASVLIGGLVAQGRLRLSDSVSARLGPGWSRAPLLRERAITVRQLLTMSSGLDDSLRYSVPPGTRFYYNNPAYFTTFDVLERAAGQSVHDVMRAQLSAPLGLQGTAWRPAVEADGTEGWRLWMTPRDMARFGLFVAAGGRWDDVRPAADSAYVAAMLTPQAPDNPAYGYLWWLNGQARYRLPGPAALPTFNGPLISSAPADLVSALGAADKKIYVSRALDVVVVRYGADAGDGPLALGPSSFDEELWRRLRMAMRY